MLNHSLFWLVAIIFVFGQAVLIKAAWRLRHAPLQLPPGMMRSHGTTDFAWTLLTAAFTALLLYGVYVALP